MLLLMAELHLHLSTLSVYLCEQRSMIDRLRSSVLRVMAFD